MSWARTSTPAISSPTTRAASTARAATSGWTRSVISVAVPPVLKLAVLRIRTRAPAAGMESGALHTSQPYRGLVVLASDQVKPRSLGDFGLPESNPTPGQCLELQSHLRQGVGQARSLPQARLKIGAFGQRG
jgi:hypothetical protein